MGNGNIDVGNKTRSGEPGQPSLDCLASGDGASESRTDQQNPLKMDRAQICGAMSQQRGESGNQSAPQKLVHLVGCRDPKALMEPWVRPRPIPLKP